MRAASVLLLGLVLASQAGAAEVTAVSRVDAVTVFPAGAEVTRLARVRLDPGEHAVVFPDLPAGAVQNSIRVEGRATDRLEIGSVDSRRLSVPRLDPEAAASDDKRGVVAWETKLEPDEERVIEFGYRVTWPGGRNIVYGR